MEYNLKDLAKRINNLDSYYEFSDDHRRLISCTEEERAISHWLNGLTDQELGEVLTDLDKDGEFNYNRYFKDKYK